MGSSFQGCPAQQGPGFVDGVDGDGATVGTAFGLEGVADFLQDFLVGFGVLVGGHVTVFGDGDVVVVDGSFQDILVGQLAVVLFQFSDIELEGVVVLGGVGVVPVFELVVTITAIVGVIDGDTFVGQKRLGCSPYEWHGYYSFRGLRSS